MINKLKQCLYCRYTYTITLAILVLPHDASIHHHGYTHFKGFIDYLTGNRPIGTHMHKSECSKKQLIPKCWVYSMIHDNNNYVGLDNIARGVGTGLKYAEVKH